MSREWEPGDVAMVTWDDASAAVKQPGGRDVHMLPAVRTTTGGWAIQYALSHVNDNSVIDARALVVIDPEDAEQVEQLRAVFAARGCLPLDRTDDWQQALREFANPTPPKPDEPTGLGAVVEDTDGRYWVRGRKGMWTNLDAKGMYLNWKSWDCAEDPIDVVRVLSEGVQP